MAINKLRAITDQLTHMNISLVTIPKKGAQFSLTVLRKFCGNTPAGRSGLNIITEPIVEPAQRKLYKQGVVIDEVAS